jgi:type VI secretion system protein ImpJ
MRTENRVAWSEGMFLRVQHFQQADRWTERLVRTTAREISAYPWGISEIEIDRSALKIGQFALSAVRGILPDGTSFEAPVDAELPPPLVLDETVKNATIYIALPGRRPGRADIAINGNAAYDTARVLASPFETPDSTLGTDFTAQIDVGRLNLRFLKTGDELAGYELLNVARVVEVRSDKSVILDKEYIAPCLNCTAEPRLAELITELAGIVRHRAEAIAERIGDPTIRGTAEVGDYLLLQILNRAHPKLRHLSANATRLHPIAFFEHCLELAGELATYTADTKLAKEFPPYRHEDLKATFAAVFDDLRASLSAVLEQTAIAIDLVERRHGVKVGTIHDRSLLADAGYVLAVRADMSVEDIRRRLPAQIKVGPVERIAELVNVALPGIPVRPLPVLPRQLPYRSGTVYFELDTKHSLWKQLDTSGAIALHLAADFPGLEMELWALKE